MLVILSGLETINKKFLARKILASLNTFTVDGYTVDFSIEPFKVTDTNGKIVYCIVQDDQPATNELILDLDNDGVVDPEGVATFNKIVKLHDDLFLSEVEGNHFNSVFVDPAYDYGITDINEFSTTDNVLIHPHTYNDVLENYKNRICDTHVITGIFSKVFIDKIRADLGVQNVTALNIIRNPSTCILLNPKTDEHYEDPSKERTIELDNLKLMRSLENAIVLSDVDYVTTIKFEDIIITGKFIVNGVEVGVPDGYNNHNGSGIITQWEKENIIPLNLISDTDLKKENLNLKNYTATYCIPVVDESVLNFLNNLKTIPFQSLDELRSVLLAKCPANVFERLGYIPLSYAEIVN